MPLTPELIQANEPLKTLSAEQVSAVVQLHENVAKVDLQKGINDAIGAVHRQYDEDILAVTGTPRPDGVKTYVHVKEVLAKYKTDAEKAAAAGSKTDEQLKKDIEQLQANFNAYKEKSIESADATLRHKLTTTEQLLKDHETTINNLRSDYEKAQKEKAKILQEKDVALVEKDVDFEFQKAKAGLTFKQGISKEAAESLVEAEKRDILLRFIPEIGKDAKGNKTIQFRNKTTNEIEQNDANFRNPYTPGELLTERLEKLDIIDKGRQATGAGTKAGAGGGAPTANIDAVRSAKTKVEADEAINAYLKGQGITTASRSYLEEFQKIRKEHNVAQLP